MLKEMNSDQLMLWGGGVPCQPASQAGKRKGKEDDRWLWGEAFRVVSKINPSWCVFENVYGLLTLQDGMVFEHLLSDLESIGYEVQSFIVPACAVNATHRRDRVWIIGHSESNNKQRNRVPKRKEKEIRGSNRTCYVTNSRLLGQTEREEQTTGTKQCGQGAYSNSDNKGLQGHRQSEQRTGKWIMWEENWKDSWIQIATKFCRVDDGISNRVDRLKSLGNAVVPQITEIIGKAIVEVEKMKGLL